ncbi:MAG: hypothetical protein EVA96_00035 [SAR86 cluster bacterium]|uniref:Esterase n=1 Tax=SAR86 cluster bacterium TaxID=2030880 RepID=A0A520MPP6_9GAMM|nr:MAG: hypothetical protein EVA96_00035 [SAR86 cluster bacterium]
MITQRIIYLSLILFSMNISSNLSIGSIEEVFLESNQSYQRRIQIFYPYSDKTDNETIFIIMNDGEELFNENDSWNGKAWNIDKYFLDSAEEITNKNIVVIAIDSAKRVNGKIIDETRRYAEYFPNESIQHFDKGLRKNLYKSLIDKAELNHPDFITKKLLPFLEDKFNTKLGKHNLGIMGASMGGLSAINTVIEHPDLFGFVGCISTHWIGIRPSEYLLLPFSFALDERKIIGDKVTTDGVVKYIEMNSEKLKDIKIYFDHGTESLDAFYPDAQKSVNNILDTQGIEYKYIIFDGYGHEPEYFGKRFGSILSYLIN